MRQYLKIFVQTGFILSFLLSASPILFAADGSAITGLDGKASIIREGQTMPAQLGMELKAGDAIQTDSGSSVDFAMNGTVGTRVTSSSEAILEDSNKENMKIRVKVGKLLLNLDKLPTKSSFKVETPTAVAVVRGTQFSVQVDTLNMNNPTSSFAVRDGNIQVFMPGTNETFNLGQGQAIDIPKDLIRTPSIRQAAGNELRSLEQTSLVKTC
jgi:hypothetical protein